MTINVNAENVPIDSIKAHPSNPRLGDVAAIAESLEVNGQYSPVVVWNDTIIAGTHTWKAAKSLGWSQVAITRFEGSEDDALRILITDNRTSDIASYDNELLLELLKSLPDLDGTGYDLADLDELDGLHNSDGGGVSSPLLENEPTDDLNPPVDIRLGDFYGKLDPTLHELWLASITDAVGEKKAAINKEIKNRLDFPETPKPPRTEGKAKRSTTSEQKMTMVETSLVPLSELRRFPGNPREGDIGAISESLRILGQYRPIVVNSRTNQILKGNHTAAAASALGWTEVAVVWVDVDDDAAAKIVIADNRTADKATYDNDLLVSTIAKLDSLEGSGFDDEDYLALQLGKDTTPGTKETKAKFQIGTYGFSTPKSIYDAWAEDTLVPDEALHRLGLPLSALLREAD
jgi:ParB-like chromosome segregation protein Spo0J